MNPLVILLNAEYDLVALAWDLSFLISNKLPGRSVLQIFKLQ